MEIFKLLGLLILIAGFSITSCSKLVRGPRGTQGPQGEQGTQGPEGDRGPRGEPGTVDSLNVYCSDWTKPDSWTESGGIRYGSISVSKITKDIINNGTVYVYYKHSTGNNTFIYKMPWKGTYDSPNYLKANIDLGKIIIETSYGKAHIKTSEWRYCISAPK
jgi:hypothetical protein